MTDYGSKKGTKTTRHILIAAFVAAFGLMVTTGVRAADDQIAPPSVPGPLEVEDGNVVFRVGHGVGTQNYVCAPSATSVSGVAFSLFAGGGALVLVFTLAALTLLVGYLARRPDRQLLWLPTGMLVGGAIGNLIDRISSGGVADFIKLPHWPAFNVADMSITFGVLTLLWVLEGRRDR